MNREDKERTIGKVVAINSDRFTVELLSGIDNFNINGYDDMHYFAQLNSYIIIPYQNYYIVAEVIGVREKDLNVPFSNPKEQILNKVRSGKFLEVFPIGSIKQSPESKPKFEFGVSVYPALYTDVLYIKEAELDTIFNVNDAAVPICIKPETCVEICTCTESRYTTLSLGKSTIFPDYNVKIDIDKFFGSHTAVLGNTGSGKSCTISSILQNLYYNHTNCSATGSSFIIYDVNGEYKQAFSKINDKNSDIEVLNFSLDPDDGEMQFKLPHWFLNIDEWALLLQASEKTQLPILRNALGLAAVFNNVPNVNNIKNHILATCITHILRDETSSPSKKDRITSLLKKFNTDEININKAFTFIDKEEKEITKLQVDKNKKEYIPCTIANCLIVHYGGIVGIEELLFFLERKNEDGEPIFITNNFTLPSYDGPKEFAFNILEDVLDLAILYEEAHGNRQIRDYCSSMVTRAKGIIERQDFQFLKLNGLDLDSFKEQILGHERDLIWGETSKKHQIVILNLSSVEDEIVEVISCVLSRIIYQAIKEVDPRNIMPVNLILEEAHRYIGNDPSRTFLKANKIFDQIAKEGRKFGMFILLSSQRPSELSRTVLSQCSNFIVHRIQNPEDLSHIRQITPHISEAILKRMPSIPTQNALIFGNAVNLPTMFVVNDADPRPKSDNNEISKNWFKPKNHVV